MRIHERVGMKASIRMGDVYSKGKETMRIHERGGNENWKEWNERK